MSSVTKLTERAVVSPVVCLEKCLEQIKRDDKKPSRIVIVMETENGDLEFSSSGTRGIDTIAMMGLLQLAVIKLAGLGAS